MHQNKKKKKIELQPETTTDLFILSKIIEPNDIVYSKTSRRVKRPGSEDRSGNSSTRLTVYLGIEVSDWTFQDSVSEKRLRVQGRIVSGPEKIITLGSSHTLNLSKNTSVTIIKPNDWQQYHLDYIEEAKKASERAPVAVIAIETGYATLALIDNFRVEIIAKIKQNIPRKTAVGRSRDESLKKFFNNIRSILVQNLAKNIVDLVIAGPQYIRDRFKQYLDEDLPSFSSMRLVLDNVSSGTEAGIQEVIHRGTLDAIASDYRILQETKCLDVFIKKLAVEPTTISYGHDAVKQAAEVGAIESLLVTDDFLQVTEEEDPESDKLLINQVRNSRGKIFIIDSKSENGKQVKKFGNWIALLRFPVTW